MQMWLSLVGCAVGALRAALGPRDFVTVQRADAATSALGGVPPAAFAGMHSIANKGPLARNMNRLCSGHPEEFWFIPPTFIMPAGGWAHAPPRRRTVLHTLLPPGSCAERADLREFMARGCSGLRFRTPSDRLMQHLGAQAAAAPKRSKPKRKKGSKKKAGASSKLVFIVKPDVAAQGRGIIVETQPERLLQTPSPTLVEAAQASSSTRGNPETATVIVQQYVPRPLTVGGHKFDLRLYCAVVSVHPTIRAFLLVRVPCCKKLATVRHSPAHAAPWRSSPQTEGLARFATVKYTPPTKKNKNSSARNMHLTNYSVNKAHNKGLPDLLPVTSVPIGDAASVPTLHGAGGAGGLTVDDDRLFPHGAALSHTPRTGLGRAALETHAGAPPCPTPAPFPQVDPFAHLRRDPALREVRGVKWSLSALMAHLRQELGVDTPALWRDIRLVIAKTLLTIAPDLAHQYASASAAAGSSGGAGLPSGSARRSGVQAGSSAPHNTHKREGGFMCCELLGFDILLDTDTTWATPRFKPHPRPAPAAAAPGGGEPVTGPGDGAGRDERGGQAGQGAVREHYGVRAALLPGAAGGAAAAARRRAAGALQHALVVLPLLHAHHVAHCQVH